MHTFIKQESGAVTVDWVVLTAALVGLGLATMAVVSSGVEDTSGDIKSELLRDDIISTSFPAAGFDYDGNITDSARFASRYDGLVANAANLTPEELQAQATGNIDHAVYWGLVEINDRGNKTAALAQLDYILADEKFATEQGLEIGVVTTSNPTGMTSADFIAAIEAEFGPI